LCLAASGAALLLNLQARASEFLIFFESAGLGSFKEHTQIPDKQNWDTAAQHSLKEIDFEKWLYYLYFSQLTIAFLED
jgi:4-alpha-glucanotransferase